MEAFAFTVRWMVIVSSEDVLSKLVYNEVKGWSSKYEEPLNEGKNIEVSEIKRKKEKGCWLMTVIDS